MSEANLLIMLLKNDTLERIKTNEISLVFRRWKRPTVKTGGTLVTRSGLLAIESVEEFGIGSINLKHAKAAGFESVKELREELSGREGTVYKIKVRYSGEDPRIALRNKSTLSREDFEEIRNKLRRMDSSQVFGEWTLKYLRLIRDNPEVLAADIASKIGMDKPRFKANVRKLKALGLTESMAVGYRLSPRGKTVLNRMEAEDKK